MASLEPTPRAEERRDGPDTGLEESVWQLELGGEEPPAYPLRQDRPDCSYYMRTGTCGYGDVCRYNHPRNRGTVARATGTRSAEHRKCVSRAACRHFVKHGTCRYGDTCKYEHPKLDGSVPPTSLNKYGYPLRQGEKECSYYTRTGHCKFGLTCKFSHPEPSSTSLPLLASPSYSMVQPFIAHSPQQYPVITSWEVARQSMLPASYMQGPYGPVLFFPGIMPDPGWSTFPATVIPLVSSGGQHNTVQGESQYGSAAQISGLCPAHTESYPTMAFSISPSTNSQTEHMLPERLDEPECQEFKRTGYCTLGSRCKYHHPPANIQPEMSSVLGPLGHPLLPDYKLQ